MARRVLAWAAMCDGVERAAMQINNTETTPSRSDIMVPSPLKRIKWRMDCTAIWFQLTIASRWRWGRINFLWDWQKFLLHFIFARSIMSDCRNEGEASVKVTSWL